MKAILNTHDFNAVTRGGGDVPGALLPAGVLVRPVGAAEGSAGAVDLVLTLSWREREEKRTKNIKNQACKAIYSKLNLHLSF